jgi:hypothetical protein
MSTPAAVSARFDQLGRTAKYAVDEAEALLLGCRDSVVTEPSFALLAGKK